MNGPMDQFEVWGKDNSRNPDGPLLVVTDREVRDFIWGYGRPLKRLPLTENQRHWAGHTEEYNSGLDA